MAQNDELKGFLAWCSTYSLYLLWQFCDCVPLFWGDGVYQSDHFEGWRIVTLQRLGIKRSRIESPGKVFFGCWVRKGCSCEVGL